ncbi:hypothetical protein M0R36_10780 [bacterium]|jgi:hypothetical protein|nr:hypothetical protein [bacterium]
MLDYLIIYFGIGSLLALIIILYGYILFYKGETDACIFELRDLIVFGILIWPYTLLSIIYDMLEDIKFNFGERKK